MGHRFPPFNPLFKAPIYKSCSPWHYTANSSIVIKAWKVIWEGRVEKQVSRLPSHVRFKFMAWVKAVEEKGMSEVRRIPGFHDEPLKGQRKGERSVRLNRAYRVIYEERSQGVIEIAYVLEVNKHEY